MSSSSHNVSEASQLRENRPAAEDFSSRSGRHSQTGRWWLAVILQPLLFLIILTVGFLVLGMVQRLGGLTGADTDASTPAVATGGSYICPMMCTPPSPAPGRCPVCGMKLVPARADGNQGDGRAVEISPAARRVAGIETVAVQARPGIRPIQAIGVLDYDEGGRKRLTAYVDGRIEKLFADYTGVDVAKGDTLALLYSPKLYSAQVELLLARSALAAGGTGAAQRIVEANDKLAASSRQRLIELGMTRPQITALEQAGIASSRLELVAPLSGTVIEKAVTEGQTIAEGDTIYELADLSTLWLMLRLFPEDAALVRYGVRIEAEVQSQPGRRYTGRVSFVDPVVDVRTRTVGVRVAMPNDGSLRVGDFAKATIAVPLGESPAIYDPDLADRWISPRHPQVTAAGPGGCPICGMPLVPAASLGFTNDPAAIPPVLLVSREAVLMAANSSVVYVETRPGRFEIRPVVLGPTSGADVVVRAGLQEGEQVASKGNFLIDSQMQLVGNPSLIDPTRAVPQAAAAARDPADLPPIGPMRLAPAEGTPPSEGPPAGEGSPAADRDDAPAPPALPPVPRGPMRLAPAASAAGQTGEGGP